MATNRFRSHQANATMGYANAVFTNSENASDKIVIGMTISNITNIAQTASVFVHSNTVNVQYSLVTDASIPAGGSIVPVGGDQKIAIEPGESINVNTSGSNSCHVVISTLEITGL
jgi:hypothetical protein